MTLFCLDCHLPRSVSHMVRRFADIGGVRTPIGFVCRKCVLKEVKRYQKTAGAGLPTVKIESNKI